jgi:radical SAM superfamily enzyme YgiQ (UPF0313 family)
MNRVVLIIPDRPYLLQQKALPSLGILLAASVVKRCGFEARVLDFADGWTYEEAPFYGITCTTPDFPRVVEIKNWIRERNPHSTIFIGGPHATLMPRECLEAGFDAVSVGYAEITIPLILNGERGVVECWARNIDAFHPDRTAVNLRDYQFHVCGKRASPIVTARGCIYGKCAFCSRVERGIRFHSVEYVRREISQVRRLGFPAAAIYDDEFFTYPTRDMKIIDALSDYGMTWRAFSRADILLRNSGLVKYGAERGLAEVLLGVESGDDAILKAINKGVTVEENRRAIKLLHDLGVQVKAAMITMLPHESKETIKNTFKFCEQVEPYVEEWDWTYFTPYPGSDVWNHPERYDIFFERESCYTAYKGYGTEGWKPPKVWTSQLSFEDGVAFRNMLEARFKYKSAVDLRGALDV